MTHPPSIHTGGGGYPATHSTHRQHNNVYACHMYIYVAWYGYVSPNIYCATLNNRGGYVVDRVQSDPYTIYSVSKHQNKNRTLFAVTATSSPLDIFCVYIFYLVVMGHAVTAKNGGGGKFCPVFFTTVADTTTSPILGGYMYKLP